ncbi:MULTISPECIES: hypothetical protein [Protofrankia]|uniref:Uncharacterized protein n=1 Tax=Protofrankia coriariae TaxID=1562887 RepID=A0ABR5F4B6_9ACTN|nr:MULTISPECIES: hypothetical protein [Protofrankia]KLL11566.1 hypothetical protein FrCorBMG51_11035 [Protofrankia coriariae]ONH35700.1 hypothetical protein BL254_10430 [Protofrankia sp. BMG5.30]
MTEHSTQGTGRTPVSRPAWARPSAVDDGYHLDGLGDLALALGGSSDSHNWTHTLLRLIAKSDSERLEALHRALPWHVHAYLWWRDTTTSRISTAGELHAELARAAVIQDEDDGGQDHRDVPDW